ncbi:MAG: lytic transglycosylase domain-containing protein [Candidatus Eisenbacteria bacterium]|nr:lytic transglycosylase domain-containing protein [Candidatus Eisenbacteria bacterium]
MLVFISLLFLMVALVLALRRSPEGEQNPSSAARMELPNASSAAASWDTLAVSLRRARRDAQLARMQLVPAAILGTETRYRDLLANAAGLWVSTPAKRIPASPSARFLIGELLVARDPAVNGAVDSLAGAWDPDAVQRLQSLDPQGMLAFRFALDMAERGRHAEAIALFAHAPTRLRDLADRLLVESAYRQSPAAGARRAGEMLSRAPAHPQSAYLAATVARWALDENASAGGPRGYADAESLLSSAVRQGTGEKRDLAAVHTLLAEIHRRSGRRQPFLDAFCQAAMTSPGERSCGTLRAAQAKELLSSGNQLSGNNIRLCMEVLCELGRLDEALSAWTSRGPELHGPDWRAAAKRLLQGLYGAKRYADLRRVAQGVERGGDREASLHAALLTARTLRGGSSDGAMAAAYGRAAAREWPDSTLDASESEYAATALYELAREREDTGAWKEAARLHRELQRRFPGDTRARESLSRAGLCLERAGDRAGAIRELSAACASAPPNLVASPCFWLGVLQDGTVGTQHFERAASETNPGYFARRARWSLEWGTDAAGAGAQAASAFWPELFSQARDGKSWVWPVTQPVMTDAKCETLLAAMEADSLVEEGRLLLAGGRADLARECWKRMSGWEQRSPGERAAILRALGDQGEGIRQGMQDGSVPARYPVAFAPEIEEAARRFSLSPALILAVMRQESLLEPAIRSSAGACGLMQLMPATAARMAARIGLAGYDLERPSDNILLGACHLAELLEWSGGDLTLALAAYNAGPEAARRWQKRGRNPDEFIEFIGYQETRRFVRAVLMHYGFLREAYPAS